MKRLLSHIAITILLCLPAKAKHLIGSEMYYECLGNDQYKIGMILYRDCGGDGADFDSLAFLGIFKTEDNSTFLDTLLPRTFKEKISPTISNPCFEPPQDLCIEVGYYEAKYFIPYEREGYNITYQRCCWANSIVNIVSGQGNTLTVQIPPDSVASCNNSVRAKFDPPSVICINEDIYIDASGEDKDNDELSYSLCAPYLGGSSGTSGPGPIPKPAPPPYQNVQYMPGYNGSYPIDAVPALSIDPITGIITGKANQQGEYVISVCTTESRNGKIINVSYRAFRIKAMICENILEPKFTYEEINCDKEIQFINATGNAPGYEWDFGDPASGANNTSTESNPIHKFSSTGTFLVKLTGLGQPPCGVEGTLYKEVTVTEEFEIDLSASDDSMCLSDNRFDFFASATVDDVRFQWNYGENANIDTSSGEWQTNITFNTPGWHTVTLMGSKGGCTHILEKDIFIKKIKPPGIERDTTKCLGDDSFDFTVVGDYKPSTTYYWDFGSTASPGFSEIRSPRNISFNVVGNHSVKLTITEEGCSEEFSTFTKLIDGPVARFKLPYDTICSTEAKDLYFLNESSFTNSARLKWKFPGGVPEEDFVVHPTVDFESPGLKIISLSIDEGSCSAFAQDTMVILEPAEAYFEFPDAQCEKSNSFDFFGISNDSSWAKFTWIFGPDATPSTVVGINAKNIVFGSDGVKTVEFIATGYGCDSIYKKDTMLVVSSPVPSFERSDTSCLSSNSIDFIGKGAYSDSATYIWDFGPNASPTTSTTKNPEGIHFNQLGWHKVQLTVLDLGCDSTYMDSIFIAPDPEAYFDVPESQCLEGNSFDFDITGSNYTKLDSLLWDFGPNANLRFSKSPQRTGISFSNTGYQPISLTIFSLGCNITYTDSVYVIPAPEPSFDQPEIQCIDIHNYNFFGLNAKTDSASYYWDFGTANPSTSTDQNPTNIVFDKAGSHPVSLTMTEFGCTATYTRNIIVADRPVAYFAPQDTQALSGNSFDIYNQGTYGIGATFNWVFDADANMTSSSDENVFGLKYTTTGEHIVSLTISYAGCDSTYTDTLIIIPDPLAYFETPEPQCLTGNSFDFSSEGSVYNPGAQFYWSFGPFATPNFSTELNPTGVVFSKAGNHSISLSITDHGSTKNYGSQIKVNPDPDAFFDRPEPQCLDKNRFDFTAKGTFDFTATFEWNFGSLADIEFSEERDPSQIAFFEDGKFPVTLKIYQNECVATYTDTVEVIANPEPSFIIPESQCIDSNSFSFDNMSNGSRFAQYYWTFQGGNPSNSTEFSPSDIQFSTTGLKTISLRMTELECEETFSQQIRVTEPPQPFFDALADTCVDNHTLSLIAGGSYSATANFNWQFDNYANISSSNDEVVTGLQFDSLGYHRITLTIEDNGCTRSYQDSVLITPAPKAIFDSLEVQCATVSNYTFDGTKSNYGSNGQAFWNFGSDATPNVGSNFIENNIHFNSPGVHKVVLTIEDNGCIDTTSRLVEVSPEPVAAFSNQGGQCFDINEFAFTPEGKYGPFTTFLWYFGPNATPINSEEEFPSNVTFSTSGWQKIYLTVSENGCSDTYIDSIFINVHPIAHLDTPMVQCEGNNSFDFSPGNRSSYGKDATFSWDFGPGSSPQFSTLEQPKNIVFSGTGTHNISLIIEENGCDSIAYSEVYISPSPSPYFSHEDPQCITNNKFQFIAPGPFGEGDIEFYWDFGSSATPKNSTQRLPDPVTYSESGVHSISLRVQENGCDFSYTDSVVIFPEPEVKFSISEDGCEPLEVTFTNESNYPLPLNYNLYFGDSQSSTKADTSHIYMNSGTYYPKLMVESDSGCIGTYFSDETLAVNVFPIPISNYEVNPDTTDLYSEGFQVFTPDSINLIWSFYLDDIYYTDNPNFQFHVDEYGAYELMGISTNEFGCSDTIIRKLWVNPGTFYIPNSFSPNNDGLNETFAPLVGQLESFNMDIYDRWGKLIFKTNDYKKGWDGRTTGDDEISPQGVYSFFISFTPIDRKPIKISGSVTLLK